MSPDSGTPVNRDQHLQSVILSYLESVDAGRPPDSGEFLARHPDLADELTAFFADQARLAPLMAPLRGMALAGRTPIPLAHAGDDRGPRALDDTDGRESHPTGQADGPQPHADPAAPPAIPGYEVLGELGRGGMGVVYKARQVRLGRIVALKMIRVQRSAESSVEVRFQAEAQTVALFDHPNIVRVYESGEHAGRPYLVLEHVSGGSLADRPRGETWSPTAAAGLVADLADAVEYAHRKGVIHRDLKPANILLTHDGVPKITDFGLSKQLHNDAAHQTNAGDLLGTPAYMAPEQAEGRAEAVGPATDVFGLGAILYDLLTGRPPFEGGTIGEVIGKARAGQVPTPRRLNRQVPPALERICLRATAAEPQRRHASAAALGQDLRRYLRRPRRRSRLLLAGCGLLAVLAAAGGAAGLLRPGGPSRPAPADAPAEVPPARLTVAERAGQVLKANCYRCHGEDGNVEGGFNYVLDRRQLVARRKMVVPGKPEASLLFRRVKNGAMPPEDEQPRPTAEEIDTLERWIKEGAADFDSTPRQGDFISPKDVVQFMRADLEKAKETDRPFRRYFTITHLYNAGLPEDGLQTYRFALSKLVNSLSWHRHVSVPVAVDPARTVYRIDLRDFKWNEKVWELILDRYPYGIIDQTGAADFCSRTTRCRLPHVRADWFVFEASRPPLYHDVLQLPGTARALETLLQVDVAENLRQLFGVDRAGFNGSGVSNNNRLIERHGSSHGAYWKSYDFAALEGPDKDFRDLFQHPLGPAPEKNTFRHAGGEIIFNLPNGLQGYMLVDAGGKRIDKGPPDVVKDVKQRDGAVVNGISCMSCHVKGTIPKDDQIRPNVERNPRAFDRAEKERILELYPPREKFRTLLQEDADRFAAAVKQTGAHVSTTDPIVALSSRYEWELDLRSAAAEAGLRSEDLTKELGRSDRLGKLFGRLEIEGGTVQRQLFADKFGELVRELQLGDLIPPGGKAAPNAAWDDENSVGMKFKRIEDGAFRMGSPANEPGRGTDESPHQVEITRPFLIGVYPVTQDEYRNLMGANPSHFSALGKGRDLVGNLDTRRHPVEGISWEDAQKFCERLSALPAERAAKRAYRLPTEAEWEYACRAGTETAYSFGNNPAELDDHAWYAPNSGGRTHPVGEKKPNRWGLYDLHGNVQQYCEDQYDEAFYQKSPRRNPRGPLDAKLPFRVLRGGSWDDSAEKARSSIRHSTLKNIPSNSYGFRVVLEVTEREVPRP